MHPTLYKPGHDNKAYSVGQQRLQSMPQSLAKSRTNPAAKEHRFAIRNELLPGNSRDD
jgi:hypothetical protein